jgi:hypothetical protein
MSNWYIIESYNRIGMNHIPCVVAICPEELRGRKRPNRSIGWKFYSKETAYETREEAEKMVASIQKLSKVRAQPTVVPLKSDSPPVEDSAWGVYRMKCGCTVSPNGRVTTCNLWRKAKGALGFEERLFPKALYLMVKKYAAQLELKRQKVWHRIEHGVAIEDDLEVVARALKKRISVFLKGEAQRAEEVRTSIEMGCDPNPTPKEALYIKEEAARKAEAELALKMVLELKPAPKTPLYGPQMPAFVAL